MKSIVFLNVHLHGVWMGLLFSDDDNRITLKPLADANDCQRDYINACYVDVSLILCLMLSIIIMHVHSPFHACRGTLFQTSLLPLKVKISSSASYAVCA